MKDNFNINQALIDAAGGTLNVCGENIVNTICLMAICANSNDGN
jgi:hypothetical protein